MAETEAPLITEAMRARIGVESAPVVYEVDRTAIRMFARSVGHTDPVYYDIVAAQAAGYRDLPCPPGYFGTPVFNPNMSEQAARGRSEQPQPSRPLTRNLNGGTEFTAYDDICAGDVLTATTSVTSLEERNGRLGPMLITVSRTSFRNPEGRVVLEMTGTGIRY